MWYQAGSCCFKCEKSFSGAKIRFAFFAVLIRLRTLGGRVLARWPCVGGTRRLGSSWVGWILVRPLSICGL